MKNIVFGLEASFQTASLILFDPQNSSREPLAFVTLTDRLSESLLPGVGALFSQAGCSVDDVTAVALAVGPGSFTSLRVALSSITGLFWQRPVSVYAMPSLRLWTLSVEKRPLLCAHKMGRERAAWSWAQEDDSFEQGVDEFQVLRNRWLESSDKGFVLGTADDLIEEFRSAGWSVLEQTHVTPLSFFDIWSENPEAVTLSELKLSYGLEPDIG